MDMKILVVDDSERHQESARRLLGEKHDVTIVSNPDEAVEKLRTEYYDREKQAYLRRPFPYDAVLLDLLMPATKAAMGDKGMHFVGQLMPYGYSLALFAIQQGAPRVGILTEMNHHEHPMSAALDPLRESLGKVMKIGKSRFVLARELSVKLPVLPEKACGKCGGTGDIGTFEGNKPYQCYYCDGSKKESFAVKDWGKLLDILTAQAAVNSDLDTAM